MSTRIEDLLCKLQVHKWGLWAITEVPLYAQENSDVIEDTDDLRIEVQERTCKRCGLTKTRRLFFW